MPEPKVAVDRAAERVARQERAARLREAARAATQGPAPTPVPVPDAPPPPGKSPSRYERRTYYIRRDLADRLDAEQRELSYQLGGLPKSRLIEAVLDEGFKHWPNVLRRIQSERQA